MNVIYLAHADLASPRMLGVKKKIYSQISAFNRNQCVAEMHNFYPSVKASLATKIRTALNPTKANIGTFDDKIDFSRFDLAYIRAPLCDYGFSRLLQRIKKTNPKCKTLIEIPTYPYDAEKFRAGLLHLPNAIKDSVYRSLIKRNLVDKIVTFSSHAEINGIPTIRITNGIDIAETPAKAFRELSDEIFVICVGNVSFYHGYDRFIRGILDWNSRKEVPRVRLIVVGDGPHINFLKTLTQRYDASLSGSVEFVGPAQGADLDRLFDASHIAIDHLGLHRKGLTQLSSLKSKEYAARGIPFMLSHDDPAFNELREFTLSLPSDETPIDIAEVVKFAQTTVRPESGDTMRAYSTKFDWNKIIGELLKQV